MTLREYERVKFALADILRALVLRGIRQDAYNTGQLRDLFVRLAEDRFNIAVVGRFNRGKTSLMNAMLGMDRLPTGVVPLTSVITAVSYGSEPKAVLHYQHKLEALAAPREIATGFAPVLAAQAMRLRALAHRKPSGALACESVAASLAASATCPVCDAVAPAGAAAIRRMAATAATAGAAAIYRRSAPCLRHLAELLRLIEDSGLVGELLELQAALMERLEEDLRRLSLKQDAAQRHAASAEELAAPVRALHALASAPAARLAREVLRPAQPTADTTGEAR